MLFQYSKAPLFAKCKQGPKIDTLFKESVSSAGLILAIKILRFKRVFLTAKESSADPDQTSTVTDDNNDDADSVTNITAIAD